MTHPRTRMIAYVAAGAVAVTGALGCGFISSARNVVGNIQTLSDLSDKITKAEQATFQARYKLADGSQVTVAQRPPNAANASDAGRFITTSSAVYLCDKQDGAWTCEKTANQDGGTDPGAASVAAGVTGEGFVSAPLALGVMTAALVIPGAKVDKSTTHIAGQNSTCAKVTGLEKAQQDNGDDQKISDFTVCITDAGVLSRFSGTLTDGTRADIELTDYSTNVDASLFAPPPGAKIIDVDQLTATPPPADGALPNPNQPNPNQPNPNQPNPNQPNPSDAAGDPSPSPTA